MVQEIAVSYVHMPDGSNAKTNGVDTIWINRELSPIEARCAVTHELVHIEKGHSGPQKPSVEFWVRYETARRLLPVERMTTCKGYDTLSDAAFELNVTAAVLQDRAATLSDAEANYLGCGTCMKCPVMAHRMRDYLAS